MIVLVPFVDGDFTAKIKFAKGSYEVSVYSASLNTDYNKDIVISANLGNISFHEKVMDNDGYIVGGFLDMMKNGQLYGVTNTIDVWCDMEDVLNIGVEDAMGNAVEIIAPSYIILRIFKIDDNK